VQKRCSRFCHAPTALSREDQVSTLTARETSPMFSGGSQRSRHRKSCRASRMQMNQKTRGKIIYTAGLAISGMVCVLAIPLLLIEFSLQAVGIVLGALAGGLGCVAMGWIMKRTG